MSYLYVVDDYAVLGLEGGYYTVKYSNGDRRKIPAETVESIALFGNVSITTPCVKKLLENGIPVSYFSKKGSYFGRFESTRHTNVFRLKKQIHLSDDNSFKIPLAQKIISAKINNQAVVLARYEKENMKINSDVKQVTFQVHTGEVLTWGSDKTEADDVIII